MHIGPPVSKLDLCYDMCNYRSIALTTLTNSCVLAVMSTIKISYLVIDSCIFIFMIRHDT